MADFKKLEQKLKSLENFINNELPTIVGVEAVNHFRGSFEKEGFTDTSLVKWKDVKRRDPNSAWLGFSYGSDASIPNAHPKRKEAKKPWKKRKESSMTHYSPTAIKTKILHSQKNDLKDSLKWTRRQNIITITASGEYAKLLNEGGAMKVFGKYNATMPKRQFMGKSQVMNEIITQKIKQKVNSILNS